MGLFTVKEAATQMEQTPIELSKSDKEFVLQFAFRTGDFELTNKLIEELGMPDRDGEAIFQKYKTVVEDKPEWIENILIALERYRIQEEKAIMLLSEILSAYGVGVVEEELRNTDVGKIKEKMKKEVDLIKI